MARPRVDVNILQIIGLRWSGQSWREIASQTGLGYGTARRAYRTAVALLQVSQNPKVNGLNSTLGGNSVASPGLREEDHLAMRDG